MRHPDEIECAFRRLEQFDVLANECAKAFDKDGNIAVGFAMRTVRKMATYSLEYFPREKRDDSSVPPATQ